MVKYEEADSRLIWFFEENLTEFEASREEKILFLKKILKQAGQDGQKTNQ